MGFSMGAFTTLNAFGLDSRVPAAWADSTPFTVKVAFEHGMEKAAGALGIGLFMPLLRNRVYASILSEASQHGVFLEKNLPKKNLPMGSDTNRPLMLTANPHDDIVPSTEMENVLELLRQHPGKY